jgi:hypothetical protein
MPSPVPALCLGACVPLATKKTRRRGARPPRGGGGTGVPGVYGMCRASGRQSKFALSLGRIFLPRGGPGNRTKHKTRAGGGECRCKQNTKTQAGGGC